MANTAATPNIQTEESTAAPKIPKVPGQVDWLPEDFKHVSHLISHIEKLADAFDFNRVEPPLFEHSEIFEKYPHLKKNAVEYQNEDGEKYAMRTTGLPGMLRIFAHYEKPENVNLHKWYYLTPVLERKTNPHQIISSWEYGFEIFGQNDATADAQLLALCWQIYKQLGEDRIVLEIGSLGCNQCWPEYKETLSRKFSDLKYSLCKDCALQVEENPEAVLKCSNADCQSIAVDAPSYLDYLDEECSDHLKMSLESLDELGVPYILSPVPDIEQNGTNKTYFKFRFEHPQDSFILARGFRHDHLLPLYGHEEKYPAMGIVGDIDRLKRAWHLADADKYNESPKYKVALIPLADMALKKSLPLFTKLWNEGIGIKYFVGENSLKLRLEKASELKIPVVLIVGRQEAMDETVILRDVRSGLQEVFPVEKVLVEVRKLLDE